MGRFGNIRQVDSFSVQCHKLSFYLRIYLKPLSLFVCLFVFSLMWVYEYVVFRSYQKVVESVCSLMFMYNMKKVLVAL